MDKPFEIIFNDEHLVVVNKIAKLLVEPSPKKEKFTLTSILAQQLNKKVWPCHRLDRETTGLVIYAKSIEIQEKIMNQFRDGIIRKKYYAFAKGKFKRYSGFIEGKIIDKIGKKFHEQPKHAKTFYKVLKQLRDFSLVELVPFTGRTNQLRIQLAQLGNPILGDIIYAFGRDFKVNFKRLALHSFYISFVQPVNHKKIELTIKLAKDMNEFLEKYKHSC